MQGKRRSIQVFAHWLAMETPFFMGIMTADRLRGKEVFSFKYDEEWLKNGPAHLLDPDLRLYTGPQYLNGEQGNFGIFLDCSPDRWGRLLMRRREAAMARLETREEQTLFETDYLLGVFDLQRMGALRFKIEGGPFLNENKSLGCPPWTSLRDLEQVSLRLEEEDVIEAPEYLHWLSMLIAPGASLGGARPKAGIVDDNGALWIAKFPSRNDQDDVGAWEMVTYQLAIASGIKMAECRAIKFSSKNSTFLTKRFDRTDQGDRIHFASAMTMLGYTDGNDFMDYASYLEIVEFILRHGINVNQDLEELWRRVVFSICVSNTDDHLRNHGFILSGQGWSLSPAYDINPVETGAGLKLNISMEDNSLDLDLALSVHPYFRLTEVRALEIIKEVKAAVQNWQEIAQEQGLSRTEQELKSRAFKRAMS